MLHWTERREKGKGEKKLNGKFIQGAACGSPIEPLPMSAVAGVLEIVETAWDPGLVLAGPLGSVLCMNCSSNGSLSGS